MNEERKKQTRQRDLARISKLRLLDDIFVSSRISRIFSM